MPKRITVYKRLGETPLETVECFRRDAGIPHEVPIAYAGRLDPMAEGLLLLLIGDECKRQKEYQKLDKEYEFEVLFGIGSDTGDILGIPKIGNDVRPTEGALRAFLKKLEGPLALPYPQYSSKTVRGKPLFLWTLEDRLSEIEIPVAQTTVYRLTLLDTKVVLTSELGEYVHTRIALPTTVTEESKALGADFRRGAIIPAWDLLLAQHTTAVFTVARIRAVVSSGTYVRSLAPHIGARLGTLGLAYSIRRTKIGRFVPLPFIGGTWTRRYRERSA